MVWSCPPRGTLSRAKIWRKISQLQSVYPVNLKCLMFDIAIIYGKFKTNMKKVRNCLIVFLLVAIMAALTPISGFCNQPDSQNVTHQCTLVCHSSCCHIVLPNHTLSFNIPSKSTFFLSPENRSHEDPFLSTSKRPPIFSV